MANNKFTTTNQKSQGTEEAVNVENATMVDEVVEVDTEKETLKSELAQMKAQMEMLMKQIATMNQPVTQTVISEADKDIEVYSLVGGKLILSTNNRSDGKIYSFTKRYESQLIPMQDLKAICSSMRNTARSGRFFINDPDFVRANGLSSSYRNIMNRAELQNVLNLPFEDFKKEYNRVTPAQKSIIQSLVKEKRYNGEYVDANILMCLKDLTGLDFTAIEKLPEEYDQFKEG